MKDVPEKINIVMIQRGSPLPRYGAKGEIYEEYRLWYMDDGVQYREYEEVLMGWFVKALTADGRMGERLVFNEGLWQV